MLAKRIIPCLDVKNGQVVKGVNFEGLREVGDPVEMGTAYSEAGADELVYLDISASAEGRRTFTDLVSRISAKMDIPFTVGGGIASFDDAARLLDAGADKITINTAAVANPSLITEIASRYGSQFVVVAIDAKKTPVKTVPVTAAKGAEGSCEYVWQVTTHGGKRLTDKELFSWSLEVQERGAGEILFTSMDHDGTRNGYAWQEYARLSELLRIPVIASGGAGCIVDIEEVLTKGKADAALAASIFHFGEISIQELKRSLAAKGVAVRI